MDAFDNIHNIVGHAFQFSKVNQHFKHNPGHDVHVTNVAIRGKFSQIHKHHINVPLFTSIKEFRAKKIYVENPVLL